MGADWRALEKVGRRTGGGGMVDRYVELRSFKEVLTVQLYSTKAYSHLTDYVYSRRLT